MGEPRRSPIQFARAVLVQARIVVPRSAHHAGHSHGHCLQHASAKVLAEARGELFHAEAVHAGAFQFEPAPVDPREPLLHEDEARAHLAMCGDNTRFENGCGAPCAVVRLALGDRHQRRVRRQLRFLLVLDCCSAPS